MCSYKASFLAFVISVHLVLSQFTGSCRLKGYDLHVDENHVVLAYITIHYPCLHISSGLWIILKHSVLIIEKFDTVWALVIMNALGPISVCVHFRPPDGTHMLYYQINWSLLAFRKYFSLHETGLLLRIAQVRIRYKQLKFLPIYFFIWQSNNILTTKVFLHTTTKLM